MAVNYAKLALTAKRLISENGRTIQLIRPSEIAVDPEAPWNGGTSTEISFDVPAVQLLPNAVRIFGLSALGEAGMMQGLVSVAELVYVVFQEELDLKQFTFVRDGGIDFTIEAVQMLKPANTTILGFIGVRR